MAKQIVAIRVEPDLLEWITSYAASYGWDRTRLIAEMLVALREGRLDIRPRAGVSPFPVHERIPGESGDFPVLVCITPPPAQG